ncbi:MAG: hypothetical protein AAGM21_04165 [Pseudomonadota bacterium]
MTQDIPPIGVALIGAGMIAGAHVAALSGIPARAPPRADVSRRETQTLSRKARDRSTANQ